MSEPRTIELKQKIRKLQSEAAQRRIHERELEAEIQQLKEVLARRER